MLLISYKGSSVDGFECLWAWVATTLAKSLAHKPGDVDERVGSRRRVVYSAPTSWRDLA
jgi:hypothetical protein